MLGYRHGFHAGNFADVFKHAVLVALIQALRDKDKPFRVFDTHAGAGRYDLTSAPAQKNREFDDGVGRLWGQTGLGLELDGYLERVRALNPTGPLRWYPGSPRIIRDLLRPGDKLVLTELHPSEFRNWRPSSRATGKWRSGMATVMRCWSLCCRRRNGAGWCFWIQRTSARTSSNGWRGR